MGVYNRPCMTGFAYLHTHTHFSPGGGPASPGDWVRYAAELGYTALGVADHAPLPALPALWRVSSLMGVSPIFGLELDLALPSAGEQVLQPAAVYACNREGLGNLARLSELAYSGGPWQSASRPVT